MELYYAVLYFISIISNTLDPATNVRAVAVKGLVRLIPIRIVARSAQQKTAVGGSVLEGLGKNGVAAYRLASAVNLLVDAAAGA